jgi:hypothetical protein
VSEVPLYAEVPLYKCRTPGLRVIKKKKKRPCTLNLEP